MHDQPDFERHLEGARQDRDELGCAPGDGVLAAADAGAQRRELGEIAIAAKAAKTVGIPAGGSGSRRKRDLSTCSRLFKYDTSATARFL